MAGTPEEKTLRQGKSIGRWLNRLTGEAASLGVVARCRRQPQQSIRPRSRGGGSHPPQARSGREQPAGLRQRGRVRRLPGGPGASTLPPLGEGRSRRTAPNQPQLQPTDMQTPPGPREGQKEPRGQLGRKLEMPSHPRSPYMAAQLMVIWPAVLRVLPSRHAARRACRQDLALTLESAGYRDERPVAAFGVDPQVLGSGVAPQPRRALARSGPMPSSPTFSWSPTPRFRVTSGSTCSGPSSTASRAVPACVRFAGTWLLLVSLGGPPPTSQR
jgi:hypothetical protein